MHIYTAFRFTPAADGRLDTEAIHVAAINYDDALKVLREEKILVSHAPGDEVYLQTDKSIEIAQSYNSSTRVRCIGTKHQKLDRPAPDEHASWARCVVKPYICPDTGEKVSALYVRVL